MDVGETFRCIDNLDTHRPLAFHRVRLPYFSVPSAALDEACDTECDLHHSVLTARYLAFGSLTM
jgi:hypothetical protein